MSFGRPRVHADAGGRLRPPEPVRRKRHLRRPARLLAWSQLDRQDRSGADVVQALTDLSGPEPLAAAGAALTLRNLPRGLTGLNGKMDNRAAILERAWHKQSPDLALEDGFYETFDNASLPLLLINGTAAESGCRIVVSQLRVVGVAHGTAPGCPSDGARQGQVAVGTVDARSRLVDREELDDGSCPDEGLSGRDLRLSTTAPVSARFPLISPTGAVLSCTSPERSDGPLPSTTYAIDGGYQEGSGIDAVLDLWTALEPLVTAHNDRTNRGPLGNVRIVPVLAVIDNHYQSVAAPTAPARPREAAGAPQRHGSGEDGPEHDRAGAGGAAAPRRARLPRGAVRQTADRSPARVGAIGPKSKQPRPAT
jgi:hypothetical protein